MAEGKALVGAIEGDAVPQVFIPKMIEYYMMGKFPFDKLVKYYSFEEINQAFADSLAWLDYGHLSLNNGRVRLDFS